MQNYKIMLAAACALVSPVYADNTTEATVSEYGLFDYLGSLVADEDEWVDVVDMEILDVNDLLASDDEINTGDTAEETTIKVIETREVDHE